jgi:hypothetical protein
MHLMALNGPNHLAMTSQVYRCAYLCLPWLNELNCLNECSPNALNTSHFTDVWVGFQSSWQSNMGFGTTISGMGTYAVTQVLMLSWGPEANAQANAAQYYEAGVAYATMQRLMLQHRANNTILE